MGSFNRDNRSGGDRGGNRFGKPSFGGKSFGGGGRRFDNDRGDRKFGGGGFGKPQMHDATCAQCGKPCQVPFRPSGDREVFCSNCFKDKKHDAPMRPAGNNFGKPSFDRPSFDKKPAFGGSNNNDQFKQQFEALNNKLDKILKALSPAIMAEVSAEEKPLKEVKKAKEALGKTKPVAKKVVTKKKK